MKDIGTVLLDARESAGLSLDEVSADLSIEKVILENIEDGKTGAFSDIFLLKKYINNYAKYLGLDADKIIDEFNEYVFESTSKIPVKDIEKKIEEEQKVGEDKVNSPYTRFEKKPNNVLYAFIYILIIFLVIFAAFWAVKQITINNNVASEISYKE